VNRLGDFVASSLKLVAERNAIMSRQNRKFPWNPTLFRILIALGTLAAFAVSAGAPKNNGLGF
jgi:hypothetical protein